MTEPLIIYGTAWKKERTAPLVLQAWKAGFRAFDTACQPKHYREDLVGDALQTLQQQGVARKEFYLQTKFTPVGGQDPQRIPYDAGKSISEQVAQSLRVSLANLHTTYLDALILHSPISPFQRTIEAWRAFEEIHGRGAALRLGISNCYDLDLLERLYEEADVKPTVVQNRFYADSGFDIELRRWCADNRITYQSFWTLTANPHLLEHPQIQQMCHQYGKTSAQILFRYLHQRGVVPLTGTTSELHMQEDLAITEFAMTEADMGLIDGLLR